MKRSKGKRNRTPLEVAVGVMLKRAGVSLKAFADDLSTEERPMSHQNLMQRMGRHEPTRSTVELLAQGLGIGYDDLSKAMVDEWKQAEESGRPLACRPMIKDRAAEMLA